MKVTVIGAGYVGLVTGACLASFNQQVTCLDISREKVDMINNRQAPFHEPGLLELIKNGLESGSFAITTDTKKAMKESNVSIVAVGTPTKNNEMDLSYVLNTADMIGKSIKSSSYYHTVVIKSTITPLSTQTVIRERIESSSGKMAGEFGLCMNPEFLREGSAVSDFMSPDRIIVGEFDSRSGRVLDELYENFNCPKVHTTLANAELIKLASNSFLATMISFSNEIAFLCEKIPSADSDVVMKGLTLDRRFTPDDGVKTGLGIFDYLRSGIGFGGSCLPKDINALSRFAKRMDVKTPVLDGVIQTNNKRPEVIVEMLKKELGTISGKTIVVLGLSFKPGTDDLRESPSLKILELLHNQKAIVRAYDPAISPDDNNLPEYVEVYSEHEKAFSGSDSVIIATAWPEFSKWNWQNLCGLMKQKVIIDGRGTLCHLKWPEDINYRPVGTCAEVEDDE